MCPLAILAAVLLAPLAARADILPPPHRPDWDAPLPMPPAPSLAVLVLSFLVLAVVVRVVRAR